MKVLDQQQHGLARGGRQHQLQQRLERLLLALLRRELERRTRLVRGQRQRVRQQGHGLGCRPDGLERSREPLALLVGGVLVFEPREPGQHLDHRVQRVARVVGRGAALQQEVGLVPQALAELEQQARLADAGLSGDEHGLAVPFAGELEARQDQRQVLVAAHERRERRARYPARLGGALAQHARERDRAAEPRQRQIARLLEIEEPLDERPGVGAHDHRARLRSFQETPGNRRGVSHEAGAGGAGVARDHQTGVDGGPGQQRRARRSARRVGLRQLGHDRKGRAHRALRVVLVRHRVAEVRDQAALVGLCQVALEPANHGGPGLVAAGEHLAQLLGVGVLGEREDVGHVARQHAHEAALARRQRRAIRGSRRGRAPLGRGARAHERVGARGAEAGLAHGAQLLHERGHRGLARAGRAAQRTQHDRFEIGRHAGETARRRRVGVLDGVEHLLAVLARERQPAGQHLVEHDAERPDVRAMVEGGAARLLRRHVGRRSERRARVRQPHVLDLGEPEVEHLDALVGRHHQVGGLHVAVHDAGLVGAREALGGLQRELDRLAHRDRPAAGEPRRDRLALVVRHHDVELAVRRLLDRVDRRDRGVVECRGGPRLGDEALLGALARHQVRGQELERDRAAQLAVAGPVHDAHAAAAEARFDLVVADRLADHRRD